MSVEPRPMTASEAGDARLVPWPQNAASRDGAVECNICGWTGAAFQGAAHSESAVCAVCGSIARDRFLYWCWTRRTPYRPAARVLETSPRLGGAYRDRMAAVTDYLCSDWDQQSHRASLRIDLQRIELPDASLDTILTSHVLEHVPVYGDALREMWRVLHPGGVAFVMVPLLERATVPPREVEYHADNTLVHWRFGFDLIRDVVEAGFAGRVLATQAMVDAAHASADPWGLVRKSFTTADLVAGAHAVGGAFSVVADTAQALRHGFVPPFWFNVFECRKPAAGETWQGWNPESFAPPSVQQPPVVPSAAVRRSDENDPRRAPWPHARSGQDGAVTCNICGWRGDAFEGVLHSESAVCPVCGSISRDRFLHWCWTQRTPYRPTDRVLETSPRLGASYRDRMASVVDYLCSDWDERSHRTSLRIDLQRIDLPDGSLDTILTAHVLEHVEAYEDALREMLRVLRPGGVAFVMVPVLEPATRRPGTVEYHQDDTLVHWRFGADLVHPIRAAGFESAILVTERLVNAADDGIDRWNFVDGPMTSAGIVAGVHAVAGDLRSVADVTEMRRHGFQPAFWFIVFECRKPAGD